MLALESDSCSSRSNRFHRCAPFNPLLIIPPRDAGEDEEGPGWNVFNDWND